MESTRVLLVKLFVSIPHRKPRTDQTSRAEEDRVPTPYLEDLVSASSATIKNAIAQSASVEDIRNVLL